MNVLEYFDIYVGVGLKIIPLYPNSKVPIGKNWNKNWGKDWSRNYLLECPSANIGLLLGEIVDVEGDTEEANALLRSMTQNYPHPMYRSSKSTHHLFINPDTKLTATKFSGFEFRAYKHQSVLPPSTHEDGAKYVWEGLSRYPVPTMPPELLEFYFKNRKVPCQKQHKPYLKAEHIKTQCKVCGNKIYMHKKRLALEVKAFSKHEEPWQCHDCRQIDVREACRRIRKLHQPSLPGEIIEKFPMQHKSQHLRHRTIA